MKRKHPRTIAEAKPTIAELLRRASFIELQAAQVKDEKRSIRLLDAADACRVEAKAQGWKGQNNAR